MGLERGSDASLAERVQGDPRGHSRGPPHERRHLTANAGVPRLATDPTLRMMGTPFPGGEREGPAT